MVNPVSFNAFRFRMAFRMMRRLSVVVSLGWLTSSFAIEATSELAGEPIEVPRPRPTDMIVSRVVGDLISRHHYLRHKVDDEISSLWFDEYFRELDHNHVFFRASDIEEFNSYRTALDDLVLRRGNVDFAFDVYERFVERVQEWYKYALGRAGTPFDYTVDETILIDRRDEPWPATEAEQQDLWRRRLKNAVIAEILSREKAEAEKKNTASATGTDGQVPAVGEDPEARETVPGDVAAVPETRHAEAAPVVPEGAATTVENPGAVPADGGEKPAVGNDEKKLPVPELSPEEEVLKSYARYLRRKMDADSIEIIEVFLTSLTKVYDPHSAYMAPETEEDFDISMSLSLQGIGAVLTTKDSFVEVVSIVPGGPADLDGRLKPGDRIVEVAQEGEAPVDVVDMNLRKVVRMIRGTRGSTVYLSIMEEGSSAKKVIAIVRDEVKLTEQEAKGEDREVPVPAVTTTGPEAREQSEARVTVVSLPSFYADFGAKHEGRDDYKSSTRDVRTILEKAQTEGPIGGVILDLRSNGGGSLEEAITLAGLFFDEGPVVQVCKSAGGVQKKSDTDNETVFGGPLIVMVDKFSASASEIVAAALQDYHRAVIVGDAETHGKGTVQTIYHLDDRLGRSPLFKDVRAGSLKFTMAKFYRVSGGSTQVRGVRPDIVFPSFTDFMDVGEGKLPHVLPWDEIEPLTVSCPVDVRPVLPELAARSHDRLAANPEYQSYLQDIEHYGEARKRKTITLVLDERRRLQQEEDTWSEKMRKFTSRRRSRSGRSDEKDQEMDEGKDLVLEETLHILGDLISLQGGRNILAADTGPAAAPAVEETAGDGAAGKMP